MAKKMAKNLSIIRDLSQITKIIKKTEIPDLLKKVELQNADKFLEFVHDAIGSRIIIDEFTVIEPWCILILAAMGRTNDSERIYLENNKTTNAAKFACALGLDEIVNNEKSISKTQTGRTIKLKSIVKYEGIEPVSEKISTMIIDDYKKEKKKDAFFEDEEVRKTIRYVLVELLRNVIQHSYDPNGALIIAQRMDKDHGESESFIQIAVSDCGIGIPQSLRATRTDINDPEVALERSLWPGYSGKFTEYQTGTTQNAGMGLFFVSEMAKLTTGKFFIASKGASLYIEGDALCQGNNIIKLKKTGFDGTIVVFEMPKRGVADYDELIKKIIETARERKTRRENNHWIRYDIPKEKVFEFVINVAAENTVKAEKFAKDELIPRIKNKEVLMLNFANLPICTQSFMHSLLFETIKLAYESKVTIFAKNASPSVKDGIRMVEMYGL